MNHILIKPTVALAKRVWRYIQNEWNSRQKPWEKTTRFS